MQLRASALSRLLLRSADSTLRTLLTCEQIDIFHVNSSLVFQDDSLQTFGVVD